MTLPTYRHFCAAARVLDVYLSGDALSCTRDDVCKKLDKAVALSLRAEDVRSPDHQHHQRTRHTFDGCAHLPARLLRALGAENPHAHGLEMRHGTLYVSGELLEEWQREVTAYQSPVPIMAGAWAHHCHTTGREVAHGMKHLCQALRYSTLPGIYDSRLHRLMHTEAGTGGRLCDVHVHINGTTEFTPVWLHALANIDKHYAEIAKPYTENPQVAFFLKQLRVDPSTVRQRLHWAATLRQWLCLLLHSYPGEFLSDDHAAGADAPTSRLPNMADVQALLSGGTVRTPPPYHHPFRHADLCAHPTDLQREGGMWLYALWLLRKTQNHELAVIMHSYMLLMHQHVRLLVQQPEQFGFDQFQHITLAGAREAAEEANKPGFAGRFRQFRGMHGPDMAHVEARFSPKDNPEGMKKLLTSIWKGHVDAGGGVHRGIIPCTHCPRVSEFFRIREGQLSCHAAAHAEESPLTLGLVAHFIKKPDNKYNRHKDVRNDVGKRARALVKARRELAYSNPELARALVGKDAASNELDTPPEVFAPVFRYLNRNGITRSTYHAGEDFEHILCGIRAVHEAVRFLDMGGGDRIGHATALGINPELCRGKEIHCRKGQWLDSLVWLTWLMGSTPSLHAFGGEAFMARNRITALYLDIYGKPCPDLPVLWKAWELRRFDLSTVRAESEVLSQNSKAELRELCAERDAVGKDLFAMACKELELYHKNVEPWAAVITLGEEEQPSADFVRAVQDAVITELCNKNMVVEVLPTSNVRISHYDVTAEHHVMRWLNADDARPAPEVVLGTDDPGIFSTSLRNEYAFILRQLQRLHPGNCERPYEIVNHLIENGMSYRFKPARAEM